MLRLDPDKKLKLDERGYILLNSTLSSPRTILEISTEFYVDYKFDYPSIIKNNAHVDLNDKCLENVRFVKVNSMPAVGEHLSPKNIKGIFYWLDEVSLLRLDPNEKLKLKEQDSINLNSTLTSPKAIIKLLTKSFVDSFHEINRNRQNSSSVFNYQDNEFDNTKFNSLDSVSVNRNISSDNELSNKKYVDDSIGESTISQLNKHYKIISKCLSELIPIILPNMIECQSQIQQ